MQFRFAEGIFRFACLGVLLLLPGLAPADALTDAEVRRLQGELDQVQQEQQAVYQNFQMTQSLRNLELQDPGAGAASALNRGFDSPPQNYDDMVRAGREREERLRRDAEELKRLYSRFRELEEAKAGLRNRIRELQQPTR